MVYWQHEKYNLMGKIWGVYCEHFESKGSSSVSNNAYIAFVS